MHSHSLKHLLQKVLNFPFSHSFSRKKPCFDFLHYTHKLFKYPQFRVYLEWFFDDDPIDNFQCIISSQSQEPGEDK